MELNTWHPVTRDGSVRVLQYNFGGGLANCFAVRDAAGWIVVSPSPNPPEEVAAPFAADGGVVALVANNGFHHLGQAAWRARFPNARSYAPAGSLPRLAAKCKGVEFAALDTLKVGPSITFFVPDGMKVPDLMVRVEAGDERVWFSGDLISNTGPTDTDIPFRWVFALFGGGPGLRFNPLPAMVYVASKPTWKASVRSTYTAHPPTLVVPAHGQIVREEAATRVLGVLS